MASAVGPIVPLQSVVTELGDAASYFGDAAGVDPLSAIFILIGNLLIVFSMAVLGYLALGGLVDLIIPDSTGRAPPRRE